MTRLYVLKGGADQQDGERIGARMTSWARVVAGQAEEQPLTTLFSSLPKITPASVRCRTCRKANLCSDSHPRKSRLRMLGRLSAETPSASRPWKGSQESRYRKERKQRFKLLRVFDFTVLGVDQIK